MFIVCRSPYFVYPQFFDDKLILRKLKTYAMASVKASAWGLSEIKQAIARKGWKKSSDIPLLEASRILEPNKNWLEEPYAYGCSRQTWERFLRGIPIRDRSFRAFCQALGISADDVIKTNSYLKEDWGTAPDVPTLYGRQQELATLERWIINDRNRAIATDNGRTLISSSNDGTIRIWDIATGQTRQVLRLKRPYEETNIADVKSLTTSHKQALIALGASDLFTK